MNNFTCNPISNSSFTFFANFYGIPETFIFNIFAWVLLITTFIVTKDYLRTIGILSSNTGIKKIKNYNIWQNSHVTTEFNPSHSEEGFFTWIKTMFSIDNTNLKGISGVSAVTYVLFLRYLLYYLIFVTFISLVIILPININGSLIDKEHGITFSFTTISNIRSSSLMLLGHVFAGVAFMISAVVLILKFIDHLCEYDFKNENFSRDTLMISGISKSSIGRTILEEYFADMYSDVGIKSVQVVLDIQELTNLRSLHEAVESIYAIITRLRDKGYKIMIEPYCCNYGYRLIIEKIEEDAEKRDESESLLSTLDSLMFSRLFCCTACKRNNELRDAVEHYEELNDKLVQERKRLELSVADKPTGIAFVTFDSILETERIYNDMKTLSKRELSVHAKVLKAYKWSVKRATIPNDIIWENLNISRAKWWLRCISINFVVFILAFFLTTPSFVLNLFFYLEINKVIKVSIFQRIFPSLILLASSSLLPYLVYLSDVYIKHWTNTKLGLTIMCKTFIYLFFMVLILPSLGLTSMSAFLQWIFDQKTWNSTIIKDNKFWECVFDIENGAFFVKYVISAAFIGTAMQLLRIPAILYNTTMTIFSRNPEQRLLIKNSSMEFQYGLDYAYTLCIFSVIISYSVLCPMIAPFGLIWMVFKFYISRYNLYVVFQPSIIDRRIHWLACVCLLIAALSLQMNLFIFINIRFSNIRTITYMTSAVTFIISIATVLIVGIYSWKKIVTLTPVDQDVHEAPTVSINQYRGEEFRNYMMRSNSVASSRTHSASTDLTAE